MLMMLIHLLPIRHLGTSNVIGSNKRFRYPSNSLFTNARVLSTYKSISSQ